MRGPGSNPGGLLIFKFFSFFNSKKKNEGNVNENQINGKIAIIAVENTEPYYFIIIFVNVKKFHYLIFLSDVGFNF